MKDFLKKYHKRRIIWNSLMVLWAFVFALSINFFLIDETDFWKNLKTSVLDAWDMSEKADLYLENNSKNILLKNNKKINNLTDFSVSFTYNPEIISIEDIKSSYGEINILWEKSEWIITIILNAKWKNIEKNNNILELKIKKLKEESTNLNLLNANFKDSENQEFKFTTSWLTF